MAAATRRQLGQKDLENVPILPDLQEARARSKRTRSACEAPNSAWTVQLPRVHASALSKALKDPSQGAGGCWAEGERGCRAGRQGVCARSVLRLEETLRASARPTMHL